MSYMSSSVIKRTSLSSNSPMVDDGPMVSKRNYQVYRGMSPTTANRIESRIRELEEALESEREIHLRSERELAEANAQLLSLTERADEAENELIIQVDHNKKKDLDLIKLKKDLELVTISHETEMSNLKRRHQELINDLNEQLERATKNKSKTEKDRQQITIEIESLNTSLENVTKSKNYAESKLEGAEEQNRKLKAQVDELNKMVVELRGGRDKMGLENADLMKQLHDFELRTGSFSTSKAQLQHKLDEANSKLEEQTRLATNLDIKFGNLQDDFDKLQSQLEDETDSANALRNQNQKWAADYAQLKAKYDKDVTLKTEESDEMKRKFNARVAELEALLEQARSKAAKYEKDKNKLTIDIQEYIVQLDEANSIANDCVKRLKQAEHQAGDWQKKYEEISIDFNSTKSDSDRQLNELTRLKSLCDDQQGKIDLLNREVQKLTDALKESEHSNKDLNRANQELSAIKSQLLSERDSLLNELADAKDTIRDLEARLEAGSGQMNSLKTEWEAKLRDRDEEIEVHRRNGQRSVEELQRTIIDLETRYKSENGRLKKKYEADQQEINIQIDVLSRTNAELAKNNKNLSNRVKELELALESESAAAQEAKNSVSLLERKIFALTSELDDLRAHLDAAERARKLAQDELSESSSSSQQINITISTLTNDKKRLESEYQALQREMSDAISSRKATEDRFDSLTMEINRLSDQLRMEQEKVHLSEAARKQLEIQINEIHLRLEDSEASRDGRKVIDKLKIKVHELQAELDLEQRHGRDASGELRKAQKMAQEYKLQYEEEHRMNIDLNEQIRGLLAKISNLKREIEESEEVLGITMGKYRKVQQQLEEAERRADKAEAASVTSVRHHTNILPRGIPGGFRSVSVSREITRNMRI